MTRKTLSLLALTAAFLAGCTMIPDYTRPEAPVPAGWPGGPAYQEPPVARGPRPAAGLKWREFFADERLQTLIAHALEHNRDLRAAALNVEKARALYRIQGAELLPAVDAVGRGSRERVPGGMSGGERSLTVERYSAALGVSSWEIDFFGRIRSLEARALEEYFATEQARRGAQILLITEVARAYLALAADRENLALAESTLKAQQAAARLIQRRYEVGIAPELDFRQAQTRVDAARVDAARFTGLAANDENALNLLVGAPVAADLLPEALSAVAPLPHLAPGMPSEVLLERPDILQAEHLLKAANADIGAARAAFFPRISLTGAVGTASSDLSGLFKAGSFAWNHAAQIVLPIFDPRIFPALEASGVERDIALARYERAIQGAFREVADTLAQRATLDNQLQAQKSLVTAAADIHRIATARYEKGIDIYLSVLDAQRSLYAAQQALIAIRLAKFATQVRLYAGLGGGGD